MSAFALSVWLLSAAVALGVALGLWHLRETGPRPALSVGILHGVVGVAGLLALVVALQGPPRGVAFGAGAFGMIAAWIFGVALMGGIVVLLRRRHRPMAVMAIHAGLAITAYVVFFAWAASG